jgi:hypothetical protein
MQGRPQPRPEFLPPSLQDALAAAAAAAAEPRLHKDVATAAVALLVRES